MKKSILLLLLIMRCQLSFAQSTPVYYKVYFEADHNKMKELSQLIGFDHLAKFEKGMVGDFNEEEKTILLNRAMNARVLVSDVAQYYRQRAADDLKHAKHIRNGVPLHFHGGSMGGYMTLSEALQNIDSMVTLYPNLITPKQTIGTTLEGRPMYLYKISDNPALNETQEQKMMYTALHHAREPQSLAQLVYYMWYLLENYNTSDSVVTHLVNDREMFFIPILNPDGYVYNESIAPGGGGMWRKNRQLNSDGSIGVDLNRNYGFNWGWDNSGSSPIGSSETYRGDSAFSEFETQAMRNVCLAHPFKIVVNYHSYGDYLIYPWGYINVTTPDDALYNVLASHFTVDNAYQSGTCMQTLSYLTNGGSDDWLYGDQTSKPKMFGFTPEVGSSSDGFWPIPSQMIPLSQINLTQNMMASWMSGPYIERNRNCAYDFSTINVPLNFSYANRGLDTCLNLKSWFSTTSAWVTNSDTFNTTNLMSQQITSGPVQITLNAATPSNTIISGRLYTLYNHFLFSDTVSFRYKGSVGITEVLKPGISLAPNPSNGIIHILSQDEMKNACFVIRDMTGRMITRKEHVNNKTCSIDLSTQPKGIYLVEMHEGDQVFRTKIVLE